MAADDVVDTLNADDGGCALGLASRVQAARTAALLADVTGFVRRYVVQTNQQVVMVALWVLHSWVIEAFDVTPYLAVTSPAMRAGKSRLFEVLELLLRVPLRTANVSVAALFRIVDDTSAGRVAILLDEADAVFRAKGEHEDLRALLNAGYRRGAVVARCEGDGTKVRVVRYDAFGAKAIAAIGSLPGTIMDRAIPIRMQRRARHEPLTKFRQRDAMREAAPIRVALEAWAIPEIIEHLREAQPETPAELNDRAADGWAPLLAIADLAGGEWPLLARQAAVTLSGGQEEADDSAAIRLLADIRDAYVMHGENRLPTDVLLAALREAPESPWSEWRGDRPLSAVQLAKMLKPFGVRPKVIRRGAETVRGYLLEDFTDVFARYLPPQPVTPVTTQAGRGDSQFSGPVTRADVTGATNDETPRQMRLVTDVTGARAGDGAEEALKDPLIRRAVELFGGTILEVKETTP